MKILLAEDNQILNETLKKSLVKTGYAVDNVFDGEDAVYYAQNGQYDVIILDILMPGLDGYQVVTKLRAEKNMTPVLFLSALDSVEDKVKGLDLGADDYLVKPFAFEELNARIRVLTRIGANLNDNCYQVADIKLDPNAHKVFRGDEELELSAKEYRLLELLMSHKGDIITRQQIEESLWSYDYEGYSNVIDVYVSKVRKKIDGGREKKLLKTVKGLGYTMREE
ncbi:MAG: response regulator transcription factor [Clostridia bacterium]|nr:response regulator transcription factor [Clostridia bacterium]